MSDVKAFDEEGNMHYFPREVYDALRAVGLFQTIDGRVIFRQEEVDFHRFPELAVCDFCNQRPITWDIDANDFDIPGMHSAGGWAACEPCGQAVLDGNRALLETRALAHARAIIPPGFKRLIRIGMVRTLIATFWTHYRSIKRLTPHLHDAQEGTADG